MTRILWALGAVLFIVAIALATVNMYARWQQDQYFGEVVRMTNGDIVIRDARVGERVIHVNETTAIIQGRKTAGPLEAGDQLIVFGEARDGRIEASLIRVIDEGPASGRRP
ncbi:hypothetical protein A3A38_03720 [Candidatus Kaiserbacteria bacterium RIFCSPLOWO2_01_FULL_53_17]|uniref:DUF5666 domain-containing protein n=1 Tax=Candidatus Kaiserbacteria bacterium RIFCSPLOWO2_01_FULL_53_17 TaxID=1798511 RepID=A0A1F6EHE8_9BACT|nr:MAG: hypothetical protein A3A38_03720 [Candidatus Kaiserbacteria bacterium RIFCSPLOWO2_01_FULL_53_17]